VHLVPIDKNNWEDAAKLQVREDQAEFVAPNVWSIAESQFYPWTRPRAIYDADTMVGFLVYGRDPEDDEYWLYRFMIDRSFQGRGHGRRALDALIEEVRRLPESRRITVGYQPNNAVAERLYFKAGFKPAGMASWGERLARLELGDRGQGSGVGDNVRVEQ
jgi:diamine N-acetyltransferase